METLESENEQDETKGKQFASTRRGFWGSCVSSISKGRKTIRRGILLEPLPGPRSRATRWALIRPELESNRGFTTVRLVEEQAKISFYYVLLCTTASSFYIYIYIYIIFIAVDG